MTTLTPETLAELRRLQGTLVPMPYVDCEKPFGTTYFKDICKAVNALPALLDKAEECERLKSELDEAKHEVDVFADSNAESTRILDRLADDLAIPSDQEFSMAHADDLLADRDRLAERVRELEARPLALEVLVLTDRAERAESELTALRATIAAVEPFDADEVKAMRASNRAGQQAQHSTQDNYAHFLTYTGISDTPEVRLAYFHGANDDGADDLVECVGYKKGRGNG